MAKGGKLARYLEAGSAGPFNPMPTSRVQKANYVKRIIGRSDKVTLQNMEAAVTDYMDRIVRDSKAVSGKTGDKNAKTTKNSAQRRKKV